MPDLGDLVPLTVAVRGADGEPANATTVSLVITRPDGTSETITVENPPASTGVYFYDYLPITPGRYIARWNTTGPTASFTDTFDVRDMAAVSILSLSEAKRHLNMSPERTTDDEELRGMIEAVTSVVERHRNEIIARRSFTEHDVMGNGNRLVLMHHPVLQVTSLVDENGVAVDTTQWILDSTNGTLTRRGRGWLHGRNYSVTYVAGYAQIPAHYVLAAKIILQHLWQTQRIQSVGQQPTLGGQSRRDEQIVTPSGLGFAIPHRAIELLGTRPSIIV